MGFRWSWIRRGPACCVGWLVIAALLLIMLGRWDNDHGQQQQRRPPRESVDVLVFSKRRPLQLYALLESLHAFCTGFEQVWVVLWMAGPLDDIRPSDGLTGQAIERLLLPAFPHVHFVLQPGDQFMATLDHILRNQSRARFILPLVDEDVFLQAVDLGHVAWVLSRFEQGQSTFQARLSLHLDLQVEIHPSRHQVGQHPDGCLEPVRQWPDPVPHRAVPLYQLKQPALRYVWFDRSTVDVWRYSWGLNDLAVVTTLDGAMVARERLLTEWLSCRLPSGTAVHEDSQMSTTTVPQHPGDLEQCWGQSWHLYRDKKHLFFDHALLTNIEWGGTVREDTDPGGRLLDRVDLVARMAVDEEKIDVWAFLGWVPHRVHNPPRAPHRFVPVDRQVFPQAL